MKTREKIPLLDDKMSPFDIRRIRVVVHGAVQGVGFRPFVYRLAKELGLNGWVSNNSQGVIIEAEASPHTLETFLNRIEQDRPPRSFIQSLEFSHLDTVGFEGFEIHHSNSGGVKSALVMPDIATCHDCLQDISDPQNRRYRYPFTNCTNCGPRYSIITALPYDRANTSMSRFIMCPGCQKEYDNPEDRRFHAQPNACPVCGPNLELRDKSGKEEIEDNDLISKTAQLIKDGIIVAVKGLGGVHLLVDARDDKAVEKLRRLKGREEKPLALMLPSLESAGNICHVSEMEARLLRSPEAPIVLLKRIDSNESKLSRLIAPDNPYLGIMLPYTPLHHLLMKELDGPIVATSGNIADESICIDNKEAVSRLGEIADYFLIHNRPIVRPVDDSVVRIIMGREMIIRRARGYAPLPFPQKEPQGSRIAVGSHLKNNIAVSSGNQIFVSQHIGDLETAKTFETFKKTIDDLTGLYEIKADEIICDLHPDYLSSRYAGRSGLTIKKVQHHHAHIYSCMAENELNPPVLGVAWDGAGFGLDSQIWGGEFFMVGDDSIQRIGHFRPFRLFGGEHAIREPRRVAFSLLYNVLGEEISRYYHLPCFKTFNENQLKILKESYHSDINSPFTTSAGRLFDAVSSLLGICHRNNFEGQAAMKLEHLLGGIESDHSYEFDMLESEKMFIIDWKPLILSLLNDLNRRTELRLIAVKFHNTMANSILNFCRRINCEKVALSGGCFQNLYLLENTVNRLQQAGFKPYWHQRVPTNDGGISLGQTYSATLNYRLET